LSEITAVAALGDLFDDRLETRDRYRVDAWPLGRKRANAGLLEDPPAGVLFPRSTEDVSRILRWASAEHVPVVPWGGGSSVTGAAVASSEALVLDMRGLNRVLEIDAYSGRVTVEAGVIGADLERTLEEHDVTTWFAPQSIACSTVGGWVATGASGQFSSRWGSIENAVVALKVVLADGSVVTLGTPPRGAVGPDLKNLLIGSEGSLGVITEVVMRIHPRTELVGLEAFALPGVDVGLSAMRTVMQSGLRPALLRLYDSDEAKHLAIQEPVPAAVLLVGFEGLPRVADAERDATAQILSDIGSTSMGPGPAEAWMATRNDFSRVENLLAEPGGYAETIEIADGWGNIAATYAAMKEALAPLADEVLGHFSHGYTDGTSLYLITLGRASDDTQAVEHLEQIWSTAMTTALHCKAVISHHHGIGRARAPFLREQLQDGVTLLARLKEAFDPSTALHPSSLVPTAPLKDAARQ
jgi:alkyldihydroxyacetonephosphate synthase